VPYKNRKKEYAKRKQERLLDKLAAYEEFRANISPKLQRMLIEGASADEIIEETAGYAAARIATIAITETDSAKALAASKDLVDRARGKAVERKELSHKFDQLGDEALDALVISKLREASIEGALIEGSTEEETEEEGDSDGTT
jgi:hypothetical protein